VEANKITALLLLIASGETTYVVLWYHPFLFVAIGAIFIAIGISLKGSMYLNVQGAGDMALLIGGVVVLGLPAGCLYGAIKSGSVLGTDGSWRLLLSD
jgi:hypothetical protein